MTAKEAAEVLASLKINGLRSGKTRLAEAMNMAIKALSQDGDTISRQAAIDALNKLLADYVMYLHGINEQIPLKCAATIRDLPSVSTEIIHCQECEYYRHNEHGDKWCDHPHGLIGWVKETDYCSKAERRTDASD